MMDKVDSPMMDKVDSPASNGSDKSERGVITTPILTEEDDELDRHIASMTPEEYTRAERKMKIKMDLQVITLSGVLYLLSFLDRTNIGSARIMGLMEDLNLTMHDFRVCLTVLYPTYIFFEIPSNLVLKKFGPARLLPALVVSWGIVCTLQGIVTSRTGLYINRVFLGMAEAGLLPGLILYMTFFYKPSEIQLRQALYFSGASLAGAFGGLIAAGINNIDAAGWNPWRWLFLIEGLLTVVVGVICFKLLPNGPDKLKGLTPLETRMALRRIGKGSGQSYAEGQKHDVLAANQEHQPMGSTAIVQATAKFHWKVFIKVVTDPFVMLLATANFCSAMTVFSISFFAPTIVRSLGISTDRTTVLLLTVPPFFASFLTSVAFGFFSDRTRWRGGAALLGFLFAIIGSSITYAAPTPAGQYVGLHLMSMGAFSVPPVFFTWSSLGTWGHYKRAVSIAVQIILSNSGAIVSTWLDFPTTGTVRYARGIRINLAMAVVGLAMVVAIEAYVWFDRKQKAAGKRDWKVLQARERFPGATDEQIREYLGDEAPEFKRDY